jgi:hypothetical protein
MERENYFVIFKGDSRYSITEYSSSGIKQAFLSDGNVSGNESVLLRLSRIKPEIETIESFVEKNAGHLIYSN